MSEPLIYVIRPDNTALWLPLDVVQSLRVRKGQKLSADQFASPQVQAVLEARRFKRK